MTTIFEEITIPGLDEDGQQEYVLATLEGETAEHALYRAKRAANHAARQRNVPLVMDEWDGGRYVVDTEWNDLTPLTLDSRTDAEIEAAFIKSSEILELLDYCTPRQREVIELRYGLHDGNRYTYRQIADRLGFAFVSAARDRELEGLARIRRCLSGDAGLSDAEIAKRDLKRKRDREWRARKRAATRNQGVTKVTQIGVDK